MDPYLDSSNMDDVLSWLKYTFDTHCTLLLISASLLYSHVLSEQTTETASLSGCVFRFFFFRYALLTLFYPDIFTPHPPQCELPRRRRPARAASSRSVVLGLRPVVPQHLDCQQCSGSSYSSFLLFSSTAEPYLSADARVAAKSGYERQHRSGRLVEMLDARCYGEDLQRHGAERTGLAQ
jgi:hypothetical protein